MDPNQNTRSATPEEKIAKAVVDGEQIAKFFAYAHLPAKLQEVSAPFTYVASTILDLPRSAERTVALRKLLESKDAAVRAAL